MSAEVMVTPLKNEKQWNKPPISLDFQVKKIFSSFIVIFVGANVYWQWPSRKVLEDPR